MPIISFGAPCERLSAHQRIHPISQRIQVRNLRQLRLGALGVLLTSIGLAGNQAHALGFAEALDLAEQHSPRITAQRLQIDAATSTRQAAGTLPDPKLSVGIENFPISGMDRFSLTRESMPELKWPGMTMPFKLASPELATTLEPEQQVRFTFQQQGKDFVITAVERIKP